MIAPEHVGDVDGGPLAWGRERCDNGWRAVYRADGTLLLEGPIAANPQAQAGLDCSLPDASLCVLWLGHTPPEPGLPDDGGVAGIVGRLDVTVTLHPGLRHRISLMTRHTL